MVYRLHLFKCSKHFRKQTERVEREMIVPPTCKVVRFEEEKEINYSISRNELELKEAGMRNALINIISKKRNKRGRPIKTQFIRRFSDIFIRTFHRNLNRISTN